MKLLCFVFIPFLIQLMVGLIVIFSHKPGGEFVGLGAMFLSLVGIPISTMINWQRIRAQPLKTMMQLFSGTFYTTLPFLILCIGLYIFAS
jgi:hypothetical protein